MGSNSGKQNYALRGCNPELSLFGEKRIADRG
jgi:hypothetical protein